MVKRTTVDLTPPGLSPDHPNYAQNVQASNRAVQDLDNAIRAKSDLLRDLLELLTDNNSRDLGGTLFQVMKVLNKPSTREEVEELRETCWELSLRCEQVEKAHDEAGEALMRSLAGR